MWQLGGDLGKTLAPANRVTGTAHGFSTSQNSSTSAQAAENLFVNPPRYKGNQIDGPKHFHCYHRKPANFIKEDQGDVMAVYDYGCNSWDDPTVLTRMESKIEIKHRAGSFVSEARSMNKLMEDILSPRLQAMSKIHS